jgi:hypothetical protein
MTRIGRNDPCPCGSGRKYKRCCLAADEQREATQPQQAQEPECETDFSAPPPPPPQDIRQLVGQIQDLARRLPPQDRAELEKELGHVGPLLPYMERQPEIEAAAEALEAHRAEFVQLVEDEQAYLKQVNTLFAENAFAPLRFTAEDVRRAFDAVGSPLHTASDERFVDSVMAAILHLADKGYRSRASMSLLLRLPDCVAAERWMDAWILQHCAFLTSNSPKESNPFLFQMFADGYDRWAEQQRTRDSVLLEELGIDLGRLQSMSLEEVDAWMQEQEADPAKKARMEALLLAHPEQRAQASASLEAMERDSVKLLEREDAGDLLLSPEEIAPWLPRLNEWMALALERLGGDISKAKLEEREKQAIAEKLWPVLADMAGHIFTPERIRQLIAQLKTYRNRLFAAGEKRSAGLTLGAIASLEREDDPARNYFLNALCLDSLRRLSAPPANSESES